MRARRDLEEIFRAAVAAVSPALLVQQVFARQGGSELSPMVEKAERVFVIGAGKAAWSMTSAIEHLFGDKIAGSMAVVPREAAEALRSRQVGTSRQIYAGGHPLPDAGSEGGGLAALKMAQGCRENDLVIVAISGGASALLAVPADGISLADKTAVTQLLLRAGASIVEFNTVRKHLSAIKGGGLVRAAGKAQVLAVVLSDVPGNDIATIGSGLTAADPTTYNQAVDVLKRLSIWQELPESVRVHLDEGASGAHAETLKPHDPALARVHNVVIGDNGIAVEAAKAAARAQGYTTEGWRELYGEACDLGRALAAHLNAIREPRVCIVAGGEPVVTVTGEGQGGRAQELALSLSLELHRIAPGRRIAALAAGTDGRDGPTDAAGAFADPALVKRAKKIGLDAAQALQQNDSYPLLDKTGALFRCGLTGTNVADILISLVNY